MILGVGPDEGRPRALLLGARPGGVEHRFGDVDADRAARRTEPPCDGKRDGAGAAADVEHMARVLG